MKKNILSFIVILVGFITYANAQEMDARIKEAFSQKEIDAMSSEQIKYLNCFFEQGFYITGKSEMPKNPKIIDIKTITLKEDTTVTISSEQEVDIKIFNPLLYNFNKYLDPLNVTANKQVYFTSGPYGGYFVFRPKAELEKIINYRNTLK